MTNWLNPAAMVACLFLASCTSMPKRTAELNAHLGRQIAEQKRMSFELIDGLNEQSRKRVETLMHYHLVREIIIKFLEHPDVKKDFSKIACGKKGIMDRAIVVQNMVEAIANQVEKLRTELMGVVEKERIALMREATILYNDTERMHQSITANINSVVKGHEFEKRIRDALAKPVMDRISLEKAQKKIDKALNLKIPEPVLKKLREAIP